jgi:hypothetical protein
LKTSLSIRKLRSAQIILFCFISWHGYGQVNDSGYFHTRFTATGSFNRTRDGKTWLTNNAISLNSKKNNYVFNFNAAWIYSNFNRELTNNDFNATFDVNRYRKDRRFYLWGLAAFDKSYSLKIINRFQAGAGAACNILMTESVKLNISDGVLYENSDLYLNDSVRETYNTFRNSLRLYYRFNIKGLFIIEGQHFYQNSLRAATDYIIKSSSTLSIPLKKWISVTASLLYNKINRTHRENLLLGYGITIEKYF